MEWTLAWRLFRRELKQGQLVLIVLALTRPLGQIRFDLVRLSINQLTP
jgi:hypothetical protein